MQFIGYMEGHMEAQDVEWQRARIISFYASNGNKIKLINDINKIFKTPMETVKEPKKISAEERQKSLEILERMNGKTIEQLKEERCQRKAM